jgi:hypothetical protein
MSRVAERAAAISRSWMSKWVSLIARSGSAQEVHVAAATDPQEILAYLEAP